MLPRVYIGGYAYGCGCYPLLQKNIADKLLKYVVCVSVVSGFLKGLFECVSAPEQHYLYILLYKFYILFMYICTLYIWLDK